MAINFIDLHAQQARIKPQIDAAIARVLEHGAYILGPEVTEFETKLAKFGQAKYALGCANGTDAILLSIVAMGIGQGDAVFCPSFTYCATAESVVNAKATPVFVDIDPKTYNMCPESLKRAIAKVKADGELSPKAVMTVDLFGQAADYPAIAKITEDEGLKLIADSAQGFGSTLDSKHPIHWADVTTTSFFPAKPLGAYGDGGAILTDDEALAAKIDSLRIHGKGEDKYDNVNVGINSRLDSIQAAILLQKLEIFEDEIKRRNQIADRYIQGLGSNTITVPFVPDTIISTWAQFTIEVADPAGFAAKMKEARIPTARYYPQPIHHQTAYEKYAGLGGDLPNTEAAMTRVISLPMHAYLDETTQDKIIAAARDAAT